MCRHLFAWPAGLYGKHLPITVSNFRSAVQQGLYTGTIFHKVLPGAFVQVRNPLSDPGVCAWSTCMQMDYSATGNA